MVTTSPLIVSKSHARQQSEPLLLQSDFGCVKKGTTRRKHSALFLSPLIRLKSEREVKDPYANCTTAPERTEIKEANWLCGISFLSLAPRHPCYYKPLFWNKNPLEIRHRTKKRNKKRSGRWMFLSFVNRLTYARARESFFSVDENKRLALRAKSQGFYIFKSIWKNI